MLIFNPEHDLCLANGDPNFVAPTSAMKFGRDCCNILNYIVKIDEDVQVWGWNPSIKNILIKKGICPSKIPNDEQIQTIRNLSHRRMAVKAWNYITSRISPQFKDIITADSPIEITDTEQVMPLLDQRKKMVFKAPWSGSGKGLRWASFTESDLGETNKAVASLKSWCSKTIRSQGSVIAETQDTVVQDFAMLFHIPDKELDDLGKDLAHHDRSCSEPQFIGYSLFNCSNGAYKSNILASDGHIEQIIGNYIPLPLLGEVKSLMTNFLQEEFAGKYSGYLGVDMYITSACRLQPCVEINVRMTMGLLAHEIHRHYYSLKNSGDYEMAVIYNPNNQLLREILAKADMVLTPVNDQTNYAIACMTKE